MQCWQQVKVTDVASDEAGRAGLVVKCEAVPGKPDAITVRLDETATLEQEDIVFKAAQLQILG